jgi:RNA polymerase sigma factor for flagellar operon FliA
MGMGSASYGPQSAADDDAVLRRENLVLEHLPQVRIIASRIHDRLPDHIALEDLISTGVVGLLAAIDNFDPSYKVQLKTYAEHRIHGAIMDSLREMDWVPREARKKSKLIERAIHSVKQRLGREPLEEEIAAELDIAPGEYQRWLGEAQSVEIHRLESNSGDNESYDLLDVISDDESTWPSQIVERAELERVLALALDRMPKQERIVLSLYYYEELTLREIAEVMGLHLSRIGQLRVQAILRLRSHLERVWASSRGMRR